MRLAICSGLLLALAGCVSGPHSPAPADTDLSAVCDLQGHRLDPFAGPAINPTVLIFVRTDCPISNHYAPELERLRKQYSSAIKFWLVYPDRDTTPQQIETHLREYSLSFPVLRDPDHQLVRKARVTVTPEAAVFLPNGRQVYHGRIDDRYVDFGKERPAPTRRDLDSALQAVISHRPVTLSRTTAIGCYIGD